MKSKKNVWIAGALCVWPLMVPAQQTEPQTGKERLLDEGKELFLRQDYAAARQTLMRYVAQENSVSLREEADYMLVCTAYELQAANCMEQLEHFLVQYPASRHNNRVLSLVASVYFFRGKYPEAIGTFKECSLESLPNSERDVCTLRLATSYLKMGNTREAAFWLAVLKETSKDLRSDAIYHLAYIDYTQQRYDEAMSGFQQVSREKKFAPLAPYYIADIYLMRNQYDKAASLAKTYLQAYPQHQEAVQMKRILGEACFGQQDYAQAVKWLEDYRQHIQEVPSREALYKLGMSYYHTQVYSQAAERLGETVATQDGLTQNAYLHMGLSYLNLKERNQARMAFEQASAMDFDRSVKEQAFYNYALCIHETSYSAFAESVTVFERFLNEFPDSPYTERVNDYLVEVYMSTRSYMAALRSIEKISQPGERILEAKQKLLFRLGTQAFAQAAFENAVDCFSQSLQLGRYNQQTKADAFYWRGESKYRMNQYEAAAADFRQYLEFATDRKSAEYGLALYNLGYTAFKQKQYEQALTWFTRCTNSQTGLERTVLADAYNRMGDCNFYARRFEVSSAQYAQAVNTDSSMGDYALFQEAFVKGLQRDYTGKIESLNRLLQVYPSSQYVDDALYEQGRAFVMMEDGDNAIKRYALLVERYPDSPLARKAASEIGLLHYQNDRYAQAIEAYKKVISTYPGSEEARMAQRDLKSIYIDLNKVDDYMAFASTIPGGANFEVSERDSLLYVAAERTYMRGNTAEAKNSFVHYLQSFPEGAFSVNVHYYLGLMAYNQKQYAEAQSHLDKVLLYPDNKFSGEAMGMSADMAYKAKEYDKALQIFKRMVDRSVAQEDRVQALTGALRSAWMATDYSEVIAQAALLLAEHKLSPELAAEAHYYRAKSFLKQKQGAQCMADLSVLARDTRTAYGAEAKYLLAQLYFDGGETKKAEKEVLEYIEVSTPHAYWLARSFVLLSDIYVKMGRELDARQYLLSLKQNYQADDDIAGMIETRLKELNKEKKDNV